MNPPIHRLALLLASGVSSSSVGIHVNRRRTTTCACVCVALIIAFNALMLFQQIAAA